MAEKNRILAVVPVTMVIGLGIYVIYLDLHTAFLLYGSHTTLRHLTVHLRMAAIVEWSNAVFLWVNIDGKEYDNVFQQGVLYPSSHLFIHTRSIQRLNCFHAAAHLISYDHC